MFGGIIELEARLNTVKLQKDLDKIEKIFAKDNSKILNVKLKPIQTQGIDNLKPNIEQPTLDTDYSKIADNSNIDELKEKLEALYNLPAIEIKVNDTALQNIRKELKEEDKKLKTKKPKEVNKEITEIAKTRNIKDDSKKSFIEIQETFKTNILNLINELSKYSPIKEIKEIKDVIKSLLFKEDQNIVSKKIDKIKVDKKDVIPKETLKPLKELKTTLNQNIPSTESTQKDLINLPIPEKKDIVKIENLDSYLSNIEQKISNIEKLLSIKNIIQPKSLKKTAENIPSKFEFKNPLQPFQTKKQTKGFFDDILNNIFKVIKVIERKITGGGNLPDNITSKGLSILANKLEANKEMNKYVKEKRFELSAKDAKKEYLEQNFSSKELNEAIQAIKPSLLYKKTENKIPRVRAVRERQTREVPEPRFAEGKLPTEKTPTVNTDCCESLLSVLSAIQKDVTRIVGLVASIDNKTEAKEQTNFVASAVSDVVSVVTSNISGMVTAEIQKIGMPLLKTTGLDIINKIKAIKAVKENGLFELVKKLTPVGLALAPLDVGTNIAKAIPDDVIALLEQQLESIGELKDDNADIEVLTGIEDNILKLIDVTKEASESSFLGELIDSMLGSIGGSIGNEISQGFKEAIGGQNIFTLLKNYTAKMLPPAFLSSLKLKGSVDTVSNALTDNNVTKLLSGKIENLDKSIALISAGVDSEGIESTLKNINFEDLSTDNLVNSIEELRKNFNTDAISEGFKNIDISLPENLDDLILQDTEKSKKSFLDLISTVKKTGQYLASESSLNFDKAFQEGKVTDDAGQSIDNSLLEDINESILALIDLTENEPNLIQSITEDIKGNLVSDIGGFFYKKGKTVAGKVGEAVSTQISVSASQFPELQNFVDEIKQLLASNDIPTVTPEVLNEVFPADLFTSSIEDDSNIIDVTPHLDDILTELTHLRLLPGIVNRLNDDPFIEIPAVEMPATEIGQTIANEISSNTSRSRVNETRNTTSANQCEIGTSPVTRNTCAIGTTNRTRNKPKRQENQQLELDLGLPPTPRRRGRPPNPPNSELPSPPNRRGRPRGRQLELDLGLAPTTPTVPAQSQLELDLGIPTPPRRPGRPPKPQTENGELPSPPNRVGRPRGRQLELNLETPAQPTVSTEQTIQNTTTNIETLSETIVRNAVESLQSNLEETLRNRATEQSQQNIAIANNTENRRARRNRNNEIQEVNVPIKPAKKKFQARTLNVTAPAMDLNIGNAEKRWQRAIPNIQQAISEIREHSAREGYKIQRNLSSGSPGLLTQIIARWNRATRSLQAIYVNWVAESNTTGFSIESSFTNTLRHIESNYDNVTQTVSSIYSGWIQLSQKTGQEIETSFRTAFNSIDNSVFSISDTFESLQQNVNSGLANMQTAIKEGNVLEGLQEGLDTATQGFDDLVNFTEDVDHNIGAIADHIINTANSIGNSVGDLGSNMLNQLQNEVIPPPTQGRVLITEPPQKRVEEVAPTSLKTNSNLSGTRKDITNLREHSANEGNQIKKNLAAELLAKINTQWNRATQSIGKIYNNLTVKSSETGSNINKVFTTVLDKIKNGYFKLTTEITNLYKKWTQSAVTASKETEESFKSVNQCTIGVASSMRTVHNQARKVESTENTEKQTEEQTQSTNDTTQNVNEATESFKELREVTENVDLNIQTIANHLKNTVNSVGNLSENVSDNNTNKNTRFNTRLTQNEVSPLKTAPLKALPPARVPKLSELNRPPLDLNISATEKRWQTSIPNIKRVITELKTHSAVEGYQIQRNLSSGSPGLLTQILARWNRATRSIQQVYVQWVAESGETGLAVNRAITGALDKIQAGYTRVSRAVLNVNNTWVQSTQRATIAIAGSFRTAFNSIQNATGNIADDLDVLYSRFTDGLSDIGDAVDLINQGEIFEGVQEGINTATRGIRDLVDFTSDAEHNLSAIADHVREATDSITGAAGLVGSDVINQIQNEIGRDVTVRTPTTVETQEVTPSQERVNRVVDVGREVVRGVGQLFDDIGVITDEGIRQFEIDMEEGFGETGSPILDVFMFMNRLDDSESEFFKRLSARSSSAGQLAANLRDVHKIMSSITLAQMVFEPIKNAITYSTNLYLELEKIKITLKDVGKEGSFSALADLRKLTKDLGLNFLNAAQGYADFKAAVTGSKLEFQAKPLYEKIIVAMSASGLTAETQQRALLALSQMASKGRVSLEELTGQLSEALPGSLSVAARSMGLTNQELLKMVESGNVLSENLLPRLASQFESESFISVIQAQNSLNTSFNKLNNSVQEVGLTFAEQLAPFTKIVVDSLIVLSNFIKDNLGLVIMALGSLLWNFIDNFVPALANIIKQLITFNGVLKMLGIQAVITKFQTDGFAAGLVASARLLKSYLFVALKFFIIPSLIEGTITLFYNLANAGDKTLKGLSTGLNNFVTQFQKGVMDLRNSTKDPIEVKILDKYISAENIKKEKEKKPNQKWEDVKSEFGDFLSDPVGTALGQFTRFYIDEKTYRVPNRPKHKEVDNLNWFQKAAEKKDDYLKRFYGGSQVQYKTREGIEKTEGIVSPNEYANWTANLKNIENVISTSRNLREGAKATVLDENFLKKTVADIKKQKEAIAQIQLEIIKAKENQEYGKVDILTKKETALNIKLNETLDKKFAGASNLQKTVDSLKEVKSFLEAPGSEDQLGLDWEVIQNMIKQIDEEIKQSAPALEVYNTAIKAIDTTLGLIAGKTYKINLAFNDKTQGLKNENITKQVENLRQKIAKEITSTEFEIKEARLNVDFNIKTSKNLKQKIDKLWETFNIEIKPPLVLQEFKLKKGSTLQDLFNSGVSTESIDLVLSKYQDEITKTQGLKESLESMKDFIGSFNEYQNTLKNVLESQNALIDKYKSTKEELLGFVRSIEDFQLSIDDFYRQRTNQLVDFDFQYTSTLRDNKRNVRNLIQQYEDLKNQLTKDASQYAAELKLGLKKLDSSKAINDLRSKLAFGAEGIFSGLLDLLESFDTSKLNYDEQINGINQERLQIELDIVSQSRQVRDMSEAIADYEFQRLQSLKDLVRVQEDFVLNQLNSWRGIVRQGEDMYVQAQNMGFIFESIVQLFGDAQSRLIEVVTELASFQYKFPSTENNGEDTVSNETTNNTNTNNTVTAPSQATGNNYSNVPKPAGVTQKGRFFQVILRNKQNQIADPSQSKILQKLMIDNKPLAQMKAFNTFSAQNKKLDYYSSNREAQVTFKGQGQVLTRNNDNSGHSIKLKLDDFPGYTIELKQLNQETKKIVNTLQKTSKVKPQTPYPTPANLRPLQNYEKIAANLLKSEEGFRSKAYWDTNAYRVGYGTAFKGNQSIAYNKNSTITRKQADVQLTQYDIPRFTNIVKKQVGKSWNDLNDSTKASLISIAYNKGSLTPAMIKAVQRNDMVALQQTIRNTDAKTHGRRRKKEASLVAGYGQIPYTSPNPMPFNARLVPYNQPQKVKTSPSAITAGLNQKSGYKPIVNESTSDIRELIKMSLNSKKITPEQAEKALGFISIGDTKSAMDLLNKYVKNIAEMKRKIADVKAEQAYQQMIKDELNLQRSLNQKRLEMEDGLRSTRNNLISNRIQFIKNQSEVKGFTSAFDTMNFSVLDAVKSQYDFSQSLETEIRNLDKLIDGNEINRDELQKNLDLKYQNGMMSKETYEAYQKLIDQSFSYQDALKNVRSEYQSLLGATNKNKEAIIAFRKEVALAEANITRLGEFNSIFSGIADIAKAGGRNTLFNSLSQKANRLDNLTKMYSLIKEIDKQLIEMKINPKLYDPQLEKQLLHFKKQLPVLVEMKIQKEEFDKQMDQIISQINEFKSIFSTIGESKNRVEFGSGNSEIFLSKILEIKGKFYELNRQLTNLAATTNNAFNLTLIKDYQSQLAELERNELAQLQFELSDVNKFVKEPLKNALSSLFTDFIKGTTTITEIFSTMLNNLASKLIEFWIESNIDNMLKGLMNIFPSGDYGETAIADGDYITQGIVASNRTSPIGLDVTNLILTNENFIVDLQGVFDTSITNLQGVLANSNLNSNSILSDTKPTKDPLADVLSFDSSVKFNKPLGIDGMFSSFVGKMFNNLTENLLGSLSGFLGGFTQNIFGSLFKFIPAIFGFKDGGMVKTAKINNFTNGGLVQSIDNFKDGGTLNNVKINNFKDGGLITKVDNFNNGGLVTKIDNFKEGGVIKPVTMNNYRSGGNVKETKVNNYANGGNITSMLSLAYGIQNAMKKEGTGAVPIVANTKERVLNPNDTAVFNSLLASGKWQQIKEQKIANFGNGGLISPSSLNNSSMSNSVASNNTTATNNTHSNNQTKIIHYSTPINIYANDPNAYKYSTTQIAMQQNLNNKRLKKFT